MDPWVRVNAMHVITRCYGKMPISVYLIYTNAIEKIPDFYGLVVLLLRFALTHHFNGRSQRWFNFFKNARWIWLLGRSFLCTAEPINRTVVEALCECVLAQKQHVPCCQALRSYQLWNKDTVRWFQLDTFNEALNVQLSVLFPSIFSGIFLPCVCHARTIFQIELYLFQVHTKAGSKKYQIWCNPVFSTNT